MDRIQRDAMSAVARDHELTRLGIDPRDYASQVGPPATIEDSIRRGFIPTEEEQQRQLTPLDDARHTIDKQLEELSSLIGVFADAVSDVLVPADPTGTHAVGPDAIGLGSSPLLRWFEQTSGRLSAICAQVRELTNRAETGHHSRF